LGWVGALARGAGEADVVAGEVARWATKGLIDAEVGGLVPAGLAGDTDA
jgi:hypothetical protein